MTIYQASLTVFLLSSGLIALLRKPASVLGWVDRPDARKHHREPVPLIGGVAMCIAVCLGVLQLPQKPHAWPVLFAGLLLVTTIGAYDDRHPLKPSLRFLFQIGAIVLMATAGDVVLTSLGDLLGVGEVTLGASAILFTVFSVTGVINALNMSDGLDGLAGGLALIAVAGLLVLGEMAPHPHPAVGFLWVLATAVAGFLLYNLRHPWRARASVFMGDAGSTMLGFALGWCMVRLSQGEQAVMTPMTAVWILALPLLDTVTVMIRRLHTGRSPFEADRQHLHHLLLRAGWSDGQTTAVLLVAAALTGTAAVCAHYLRVPEYLQFYGFMSVALLYYRVTTYYWTRQQARQSIGRSLAPFTS